MPPFGHSATLRIFIDPDLLQFDEVWAAAGTWMTCSRLHRMILFAPVVRWSPT
ncbi:MAG: hypothetical protein ACKODN_10445 [Actinomycetota bacterium]